MALSGLHCDWVDVPEFLLDRYEVTNRQFQTFVEQKGYANPVFWKHEFVRKGAVISWTQAMQYFHDSTGRPGPKDWINGTFPSGEGEHPVRGISWYEAAAYAAFAGKRLPSIFEWSWASSVFFVEGPIASRSNLEGTNPVPVGSFDSFATYGNYDMAGNVKEWCWNSAGNGKRYALGGSWDEPRYMFHQTDAASPFERPSTYGFRCAKDLGDNEPPPKTLAEMLQPYRNYSEETPASDAMFASYLSHFDYDKEELQPTIEVFDDDDDCIRQEITLRSENQEKVLTAALYLPRNAEPPYQTVIFFGGSSAIRNTARLPDPPARHILKSGRALLHPSYFGTYDRRQNPNIENVFPDRTVFFRNHVIAWIQDVGKCIDYLETRDDIDSERTAFFGFSWGGAMGAIVPAVETRLRASVLLYGGFYRQAARPEVDQLNFAPRVKTPTLMLNNKYDFLFDHEAAQKPMFQLLGLPEEDKRHVVEDASGHFMPLKLVSRETSEWLDKYLGPVRRLRSPTGQAE